MIEFCNVWVRAGTFQLRDVSLAIEAGQYAVLMGKTGSGKTTLLESACRLRPIESGDIRLGGASILDLGPAECGVGYVPQDLALFPHMTVREHLAFALRMRRAARQLIDQRVAEMAGLLAIEHLLARTPEHLSGGEAQRVALGRALAFHPPVLLLDEPLSALDEATHASLCDVLKSVQRRTGVTVLHVTHSRREAAALADRLFRITDGRVDEVPPGES